MAQSSTLPGRANGSQLRDVQRTLTAARDEQIARVVAVVDALADGSAADALIAPLRPRLLQLRPPRPMRLTRLMFLPLDPLILPAARWRQGEPAVPRTALTPLADVVSAAGDVAPELREGAGGLSGADASAIAEAGALLWPAASRALLDAEAPPESWPQSGLPAAAFAPLARGVAGALENAALVHRVVEEAQQGLGVRQEIVEAAIAAAALRGPGAWSMTVAMLLARLPNPEAIVRRMSGSAARDADPAVRAHAERVTNSVLNSLDDHGTGGPVANLELAQAGTEVQRIAALLAALDGPGVPPPRRQRIHELRQVLDASTRSRFEAGLAEEFLAPLQEQLQSASPIDVPGLESAARSLRQIETAGRRIGSGKTYDALLQGAADQLKRLEENPALTLVDKVRIVEILAGSDQALAMLER